MDSPAIIEKHRQALQSVLAGLCALAACLGGGPVLPRHLRLAVLRLLRPAESAARRLVILTARWLPMPPLSPPRRQKPKPPPLRWPGSVVMNLGLAIPLPGRATGLARPSDPHKGDPGGPGDGTPRPPAFQLLDPLRRVTLRRQPVRTSVPRISVPGYSVPFPIVPRRRDDLVDAVRLGRRLAALGAALDDLPAQARRFARWEARNARERAAGQRRRIGALRSGRPPGQHKRRSHEVHDLLAKLHDYASYALERRDTS